MLKRLVNRRSKGQRNFHDPEESKQEINLMLALAGGREIRALALHLELTNFGLIEGAPSPHHNDQFISQLPELVKDIRGIHGPVEIIEPPRQPHVDGRREWLPSFWIAGCFRSEPLRTENDESFGTIVWFQDWMFPIPSDSVRAQIQAIRWESFAEDHYW